MDFDSLNPYQTLEAVTAASPDELVLTLKAIKTPIKIIAVTSYGTRQVAYVVGHLPVKKQVKSKKELRDAIT